MPIYEYQCTSCSNVFEQWCKCSELKDFISCPICSAPSKHIISNTAFVLKGSGWYVTEYGNKKNISDKGEATTKEELKESTSAKNSDAQVAPDSSKVSDPKPVVTETNSSNATTLPSSNT